MLTFFNSWGAPQIPPELVERIKGMPVSEQMRLAKSYGVDVETLREMSVQEPISGQTEIGSPGEELRPVPDTDEKVESELPTSETDMKRYGANIFDKDISTFAPVDNIAVPEGYRLGVGDELSIALIGKEQDEFVLMVKRDGSVTFPKLGRISLSGLTYSQATALVEAKVNEKLIGTTAIVSMGRLRSINVFMSGEVNNPGSYSVSALSTLTQALYVAGGISEIGSYRNILIKRRGEVVETFDVYDLLLKGDNSNDVRLQNGDVVFVPMSGPLIEVKGEVARPAIYETKKGETATTALEEYGGLLPTSYLSAISVTRYLSKSSLPILLDIDFSKEQPLLMPLYDGDRFLVRKIPERVANPIKISGASEINGFMGWKKGLRISDVFTDLESQLTPLADRNLALVARRINIESDIKILSFSPVEVLSMRQLDSNFALNPFDSIIILPIPNSSDEETLVGSEDSSTQTDIEQGEESARQSLLKPIVERLRNQAGAGKPAPIIAISGAVQLPGEYPLIEGGTIEDQVRLAGGFSDGAFLKKVEVRSIDISDGSEASVSVRTLDLSSTEGESVRLKPRDSLKINLLPNYSIDETIVLSGEFVFPGTYTISKAETLSSIVGRAGGFTEQAFVAAASFVSRTARETQRAQLKKISSSIERQLQSRTISGAQATERSNQADFIEEGLDASELGRIVIDIEAALGGIRDADILVQNGDSLYIPKFSSTIGVVGEVYEPGTFRFVSDATISDYLEKAGGTTAYALKRNTYLLKANGSVVFLRRGLGSRLAFFDGDKDQKIMPGDIVVVPTDLDYETALTRLSSVTSVVFQSFSSIAALVSLTNR